MTKTSYFTRSNPHHVFGYYLQSLPLFLVLLDHKDPPTCGSSNMEDAENCPQTPACHTRSQALMVSGMTARVYHGQGQSHTHTQSAAGLLQMFENSSPASRSSHQQPHHPGSHYCPSGAQLEMRGPATLLQLMGRGPVRGKDAFLLGEPAQAARPSLKGRERSRIPDQGHGKRGLSPKGRKGRKSNPNSLNWFCF